MLSTQVTRNPDDKRRFDLAGIGYMRVVRRLKGEWIAQAPDRDPWQVRVRKPTVATDSGGGEVATFSQAHQRIEYGTWTLQYAGGQKQSDGFRDPLVLKDGDRELMHFRCLMWAGAHKHPIDISILDEQLAVDDPLLVLFAAFGANFVASTAR